ncbi:MAG: hypothetical protein LUH19_00665, partial [Lachnospiraceae bacterium]|nr:hypothetical protein [Lachnospiraceae bacterium]
DGIFSSMSCPLFYTMNSTGPARAVSIVYYGFILSTFFCYYYILGYLHRLLAERNISFRRLVPTSLFPAASIVLTVFLCLSGHAGNLTVVKSTALLISGEARAYDEEYQARLEILNDPEITDVVLSSFIHQPDMLYNGDLGANPADDLNQKIAYYFNKSSVIVVSQ